MWPANFMPTQLICLVTVPSRAAQRDTIAQSVHEILGSARFTSALHLRDSNGCIST
jgi:arginine/lysine/ornithine decarboxylase